jgi:hypothetical protein
VTTGRVTVVAALGATQTIAWASSYYMPAILGAPIASALHLPRSVFFGLFSGALLLSAVVGPTVGPGTQIKRPADTGRNSNWPQGAQMAATPQNLLVIMSDEHNRKIAGHAGHPIVSTPALDALAADGSCFTAA